MENNPDSDKLKPSVHKKNRSLIISYFIIIFLVIFILFFFISKSTQKKAVLRVKPQVPSTVFLTHPTVKISPYVSGQVLVKFKPGVTNSQIAHDLNQYGASVLQTIPGINVSVIKVPTGREQDFKQELAQDPLVSYAELNYTKSVQLVPNDPDFGLQWALSNTGQNVAGIVGVAGADIDIEPAWGVTQGNGVKVAILDTGIDPNQPDLQGKVIMSQDFTDSSEGTDDDFGHGTHVAGILAANVNNSVGIAGVCPGCQLIIAKVLNDQGTGSDATIAQGIIYATDNGAQVISMSLGGPGASQTLEDAVSFAWSKGVVLVAAAGEGEPAEAETNQYPAMFPDVVSVAATDNQDKIAPFSYFGTNISIAAPGVEIYSTLPTHPFSLQQQAGLGLDYGYLAGTSMATPMVAGVAALLWSTPYGTSNQAIVNRILATADKIPGTGVDWEAGRLDAYDAVQPVPTDTPAPTATPAPTDTPVPTDTPAPTATTAPAAPTATTAPVSTVAPAATSVPVSVLTPTPAEINVPTVETVNPTTNPNVTTTPISTATSGQNSLQAILLSIIAILLQFLQSLFGNL